MRVVGIGAGGHAKVLMDIARLMPSVELVGMLDAKPALWGTRILDVPILGDESVLGEVRPDAVFIAIGGVPGNAVRRRAFMRAKAAGLAVISLIHPRAIVASGVKFGEGVMVMGGSVINADAVLGDGVIVNSGAIVEHDCRIDAFAHVCPGTVLGGNVTVGEEAFIGIGSTVIQGIAVGARAVVGAGGVVVDDVDNDVMVLGCPARVAKRAVT